ncbi:hypothetical protein [Streptomyces pratisoli]|uniref:SGM_3592 family protein n=1 Tax=Streptomyces pratisoli TaxID=3139917 RepID=UPI003C12BA61
MSEEPKPGQGEGPDPGHGPGHGPGQDPQSGEDARNEARDHARDDAWDKAVLDEDFVRGAETAEPSARARMLAARWRGSAPEPQPWRSDEPPAGWFWSRARRRRRGLWRRRKDKD